MTISPPDWPTLPPGCQRIRRGAFDVLAAHFHEHAFEFTTFGGQLLSWSFAGRDIFFANREHARTDGAVSYRGGNPICFPHFNKGIIFPDKHERSPAHGPVRTATWKLTTLHADAQSFRIVTTVDTVSTDSLPGVPLTLTVTYYFTPEDLSIAFAVDNRGTRPAAFHLAVHTYFDAPMVKRVELSGLGGEFLDGQRGLQPTPSESDVLTVQPPLDRVYTRPAKEISMRTSTYALTIGNAGFNNSVVWNPGEPHTLTDVRSPAFICVESAALLPAPVVDVNATWRSSLNYRPAV